MTRKRRTRGPDPRQLFLTGVDLGVGAPTPLSRATAKRRSRVEAPAPKPWHCVTLNVDTARRAGWSVYDRGRYIESDEFDTDTKEAEAKIEYVVAKAREYASAVKLPLVLVLEAPWGGSVIVITALGVAKERWLRAWRNAGE